MANRILVLSGGCVEAAASYEELLAQDGALRRAFRTAGSRLSLSGHLPPFGRYYEQEIHFS